MPAEFTRCVAALKKEGKSEDSAYAICTTQFERRHAGKTPQQVAKEMVDEAVQFAVLADDAAEKTAGERLHDFASSYFRGISENLVINSIDRKKHEIEGYASYFDEPMRNGMIVANTAFPDETLALYMKNPVLLRNHNPDHSIGVVIRLSVDEKGLVCRARVDDKETWDDILAGRIRAFSWAGQVVSSQTVPDTRNGAPENAITDRIVTADLLEISVVTIPNSPQSLFSIAKSRSGPSSVTLWAPVRRVDADQRMVYGYATVFDVPDADGHVMTRAAIEKALVDYRQWANVREMHEAKAVGTVPVMEIDDYGLWVGVYVSKGAEDCWQKILDRTYQGFSVGGHADEDTCTRGPLEGYSGGPYLFLNDVTLEEITICDRPALAQATFVFVKRQQDVSVNGQKPPAAAETNDGKGGPPMETNLEAQRVGLGHRFLTLLGIAGDPGVSAGAADPPSAKNDADANVQNRAMTKETETALAQLRAEMQATQKVQNDRLDAILAAVAPPAADAAAGTDTANQMPQAMLDAIAKKKAADDAEDKKDKGKDEKKEKSAVSPEFKAAFDAKVAAGATPADAYNAAIEELAGDDTTKALVLLGLVEAPSASAGSGVTAEQIERIVNSAVAAQIKPLRTEFETVKNAAMRSPRNRLSGTVVPDSENGADADSGIWNGLVPANIRGR